MKDYYDILGVDKNATDSEIKKAFKKLAVKWHPDKQGDKSEEERKTAEDKFKELNEAKEVLLDPEKRKNYDEYGDPNGGHNWDHFANMRGWNPFGSYDAQPQKIVIPGENAEAFIDITIEDIYNCGNKEFEFRYNKDVRCSQCHGDGYKDKHICSTCQGTGRHRVTHRQGNMIQIQETVCPECGGLGCIYNGAPCEHCNGVGFDTIEVVDTVSLRPEWIVEDGKTVRMSGAGHQSKQEDGPDGNLFIHIRHNFDNTKYSISSSDLTITQNVDVPYYDCMLGTKIEVELPDQSKIYVTIPECTKDGTKFRIKNKGIKLGHKYNNYQGHYYIKISHIMPEKLNKEEKKLLNKIKELFNNKK